MSNVRKRSSTKSFLKRASRSWVMPLLGGAAGGALILFGLTI